MVGHGLRTGVTLWTTGKAVCDWLEREIGKERGGGSMDTALGIIGSDGMLIGAIGFSGWDQGHKSIQIAAAWRASAAFRETVTVAHDYAFDRLGCARITAAVVLPHPASERLLRWWGYVREGTMRYAWRGERDVRIYRLTRRIWRRHPARVVREYDPQQVAYCVRDDGEIEVI